MKIAIIGAGVIGLTTAITLKENGFNDITIIADKFSPETTSDIAAAVWYPFHVGASVQTLTHWAKISLEKFKQLSIQSETGVSLFELVELSDTEIGYQPWNDEIDIKPLSNHWQEKAAHGRILKTPLTDTSIFMPYLMQQITALQIKTQQQMLSKLDDAGDYDVIINCTGLGARELCNDQELYPSRGQLIVAEKLPDGSQGYVAVLNNKLSHVFPRQHDCVIGGTDEEHCWELENSTDDTLIRNAYEFLPAIKNRKEIKRIVGLRPCRDSIRLEKEVLENGQTVIHNYGHGGAGITLSWGCADEVLTILQR